MKHRTIIVIIALILVFTCLFACAQYTYIRSSSFKIESGSKLGLLVASDHSSSSREVFKGLLRGALIARGYNVHLMSDKAMMGDEILGIMFPEGEYSAGYNITQGLSKGGGIEAEDDVIRDVLTHTEMVDAERRYRGWRKLVDLWRKYVTVDYVMVVNQFDIYGFSIAVVKTSNYQIVNTFTISGNEDGFEKVLGLPEVGESYHWAVNKEEPNMPLLRVASFISGQL